MAPRHSGGICRRQAVLDYDRLRSLLPVIALGAVHHRLRCGSNNQSSSRLACVNILSSDFDSLLLSEPLVGERRSFARHRALAAVVVANKWL